jgi:hypothetical protein
MVNLLTINHKFLLSVNWYLIFALIIFAVTLKYIFNSVQSNKKKDTTMAKELDDLKNKYRDEFRNKCLSTLETFQVNVVIGYRLIENLKEYPEKTESEKSSFLIEMQPKNIDDNLKTNFKKWILIAGFDELFKWIKDLLIEYLVIKNGLIENDLPTTDEEFNEQKKVLFSLHIPTLISKCEELFGELDILNNFHSYNKARNCLHHSDEILIEKFCTEGKDVLEIKGRRFMLISSNEEETIELDADGKGLENGNIQISAKDFCIIKNKNERIDFTLREFNWMKDLALFLYVELAEDLFGQDNRPILTFNIQYQVKNVEDKS